MTNETKRPFTAAYDDVMRTNEPGITLLMKLIYCRVLRFQEFGNQCFMTNKAFAAEFGVGESTVKTATAALEKLGLITKQAQFNSSNIITALEWKFNTPARNETGVANNETGGSQKLAPKTQGKTQLMTQTSLKEIEEDAEKEDEVSNDVPSFPCRPSTAYRDYEPSAEKLAELKAQIQRERELKDPNFCPF